MTSGADRLAAVVFDIDGTLLDSANGIVAGYQHALASVGFPVPSEAVLRSDVGPPVDVLFTALGLDEERVADAVAAYRRYYQETGIYASAPYPGVGELLDDLSGRLPLGTATAKRTDIARAILAVHELDGHFAVVNGTTPERTTKAETIADTLDLLGGPPPGRVLMVGDRHSDISAAQACGLKTVAVTWGYGTLDELRAAEPDALVESPRQLVALLA